jgi:hypothetical protein
MWSQNQLQYSIEGARSENPEPGLWPVQPYPLAPPLLSDGRRDAAVWTTRLRSGNFVWRHVLHMFPRPAAGSLSAAVRNVRNFTPLCASLAWSYSDPFQMAQMVRSAQKHLACLIPSICVCLLRFSTAVRYPGSRPCAGAEPPASTRRSPP